MAKLLATVLVLVGLSIPCRGDATETERLRTTVADLQQRIVALEEKVKQLEADKRTVVIPAPPHPNGQQIPKDWSPREFNGLRFYIVPLGSAEQSSKP